MNASEEILEFSATRDPWQRDLLRRIATQPDVTEDDLAVSLAFLKAELGLAGPDAAVIPVPLSAEHLPPPPAKRDSVLLASLENLRHVNRLEEDQRIPFALDGLTIVYGDNGSGKSGYCRVLKALCRVREGGLEAIRPDAFGDAATEPASATIAFKVGDGAPSEVKWKSGDPPPEDLRSISTFDTLSVALYADGESRLEFLPFGLSVVPRLASACKELQIALDGEMHAIEVALKAGSVVLAPGTRAADFLARLQPLAPFSKWPSTEDISAEAAWDDLQEQRLNELRKLLTTDPVTLANGCRNMASTATMLATECESVIKELGEEAVAAAQREIASATDARAAAQLAAVTAFQQDPLKKLGSEPWRRMFDYAKQYATTAYAEPLFPLPAVGALCPLCQQPLGGGAADRLHRFEEYVRGTAESMALRTEQVRDSRASSLRNFTFRAASDVEKLLGSAHQEDADGQRVAADARSFFSALQQRRSDLVQMYSSGDVALAGLPQPPTASLRSLAARLEVRAKAYIASSDPEQRKHALSEVAELEARQQLSRSVGSLLLRRQELTKLRLLQECRMRCDTGDISRKNTQLRKRFITTEFRERLRTELEALDLEYIPFRIDERSEEGESYVGVGLETKLDVANHEILSDGEFRALALACFLAEVGSFPDHSGIVFDDPVSSLDHLRVRKVANRLVREAKEHRQVIVFTHDLRFLDELRKAAVDRQVPTVTHWVLRRAKVCGHVRENDQPWESKSVGQRLAALTDRYGQMKRRDDIGSEEYREEVRLFYGDLRDTWERLIEEKLLNGAVSRFAPDVMTLRLIGAVIEDEDYQRVFEGMTKASTYAHDRPAAAQREPPTSREIQADLEALSTYSASVSRRQKEVTKRRENLRKPPAARTI